MSRYLSIKVNGRTWLLHRYVWTQVHGPIPDGMHIHHRNGDPFDNRIENLQMLTPEQHSRHHNDKHPRVKVCEVCGHEFEPAPTKRARAKTCSKDCFRSLASSQRRGTGMGGAKLDDQRVLEIRARVASGEPQAQLAREFAVSPQTLSAIVKRRRWAHI